MEADSDHQVDQPVRYWRLWFANLITCGLAVIFFFTVCSGTSEFFTIALASGLILGVPVLLFVTAIGSMLFFLTQGILKSMYAKPVTQRRCLLWPAWLFAAFVVAGGFWGTLPRKRLAQVCQQELPTAHNIQVAGYKGFLSGQWLASFQIEASGFQELLRDQQLQLDPTFNFTNRLRPINLKQTKPSQNLLQHNQIQWYTRVYFDKGANPREAGGTYASYDSATSTAIVFREYHD